MFCFCFWLFPCESSKGYENNWSEVGVSNFKKGLEKISGHENSVLHCTSLAQWKSFEYRLSTGKTIDAHLQEQLDREREKTLQILDRIFSATLFLALQGISLRGHRFESHEDLMLLNAWDFVDGEPVPRDAEDLLVFLQKHNLLAQFESIATLLKLALILSVSSAHDERAFSCLKRVKTYLRSTMTENRLSNLACISINRELVSHISIRELQQPFLNEKTRRIFQ